MYPHQNVIEELASTVFSWMIVLMECHFIKDINASSPVYCWGSWEWMCNFSAKSKLLGWLALIIGFWRFCVCTICHQSVTQRLVWWRCCRNASQIGWLTCSKVSMAWQSHIKMPIFHPRALFSLVFSQAHFMKQIKTLLMASSQLHHHCYTISERESKPC